MPSPHLNIRAARGLDAELAARGDNLSEIALRDLRRHYSLIESSLREIRLSEAEWNFLRDILNSSVRDEQLAHYLHAEVADAGAEAAQWGIDVRDLSGRLRTMCEAQRLAIVDAVDRWWRAQSRPMPAPITDDNVQIDAITVPRFDEPRAARGQR